MVKNAKKNPAASTQRHLKIAEIRDNTIVLKNGGLRAILKTSSINFNLKSEPEQNAIIYSYQNFLNTLEFPIQIVIRSQKLDIDKYIEDLKVIGEKQQNKLLQRQTFEYAEYIQKLVEYADIMDKEFYCIVPFDPYRVEKKSFIEKILEKFKTADSVAEIKRRHKEFEDLKKGLTQRVNIAKTGLENCGLRTEQLNTQQLIELFYKIYNPLTSRGEKIKDNLQEFSIQSDEDRDNTKKQQR